MLEEALERVADQMEKRDSLRRQIRAAMAYPMMIGGLRGQSCSPWWRS